MTAELNPELPDIRNKDIRININGKLLPREEARISVFDSAVQGGDAVWEGLRIYDGRIFQLSAHLRRLRESAKAMAFEAIPEENWIRQEIQRTLDANGMSDESHIRLTLTRGRKVTSGMSPEWNQYGPTLIILAEWKKPVYDVNGIRLITSSIRRNPPQCIDSKIHHNNLINNILAKIEANLAGVEDALMLDIDGFISETNATNFFIVKDDMVLTPFADSCLPGITRKVVMDLCQENKIPFAEKRLSLTEAYTANEVFVTGTMGEITPVLEIDGRVVGNKTGPVTSRIAGLYAEKAHSEAETIAP